MSNPLIDDIKKKGINIDESFFPITLPSRGVFYDDETVDNPLDLKVHALSAIDESIISDPMMILSGHSFKHLMRKSTPDIKKIGQIVDMDAQVIMLAARIASHGEELKYRVGCPKCSHMKEIDINLRMYIENYVPLSDEELSKYEMDIEELGQTIKLRPIAYEDSINLIKMVVSYDQTNSKFMQDYDPISSDEATNEKYADTIKMIAEADTTMVKNSIGAVVTSDGNELTDKDMIDQWVEYIGDKFHKRIIKYITDLQNDFSKRGEIDITCEECGNEFKSSIETDPQKLFTSAGEEPITKPTPAPKKTTKAKKKTSTNRLSK